MEALSLSSYEEWKAGRAAQNAKAAGVVLSTSPEKPDEFAADLHLGKALAAETGSPAAPPSMVAEHRPLFQQQLEQAKAAKILGGSPMLASWLRDPQNAALARDDLEGLSYFEAFANATQRGLKRIPQAYNQWLASGSAQQALDVGRSFGEILSDAAPRQAIPGPDQLFSAGTRYLQSRLAGVAGIDSRAEAQRHLQAAGGISKEIAAIPMTGPAERYKTEFVGLKPSGSIGQDFSNFAQSVAADPEGFISFLTQTAIESVPSLAAATGVTVATRSPAAGATFMGASSFVQEAGTAPVEFFTEKGIDISTPEGAAAALADPELLREAERRGRLRGVVIGALDGLSGGVAGQTLAKSTIGNLGLQSVVQAVLGASGEAGGQVLSGQQFNLSEVLLEGLAEFATAPIEVVGVGGRAFADRARKAKAAPESAAALAELSAQAGTSKLRQRMPEAFRDFLARATADGEAENVYVPAEAFVEYFQSKGLDAHEVATMLDGVSAEDLDVALATGGDLKIPTATYAADIAGGEHDAFMLEHMRLDPDAFTAKEAAEFNERAQEALAEAYEQAEQMRRDEEAFRPFEDEIRDTMISRLREAGRSTDVARTEASLYPAFYRVMAERSGQTIEEFMQAYPLPQVRGSVPQGVQGKEVDELTRLLADARNRKPKKASKVSQPLLEFINQYGGINDTGGELRARDAQTVKRGRGRKTLRLAREDDGAGTANMFGPTDGKKHGADDVALAAIEAGLMADDPAVLEYKAALAEGREVPDITRALWDAIDRELRGEVPISERDALDELDAYLAGIGLSLDNTDEEIRAAMAKDYEERGAEFAQGGGDKRGSIQFPPAGVGRGETVINLFQSANLSTFLHESGHYFLTVTQDLARRGEAQAVQQMDTLRGWWRENAKAVAKDASKTGTKISERDVLDILDGKASDKAAAVEVGFQEQFARAFEQYLFEGKAPSADLRSAFEKFRAWLISIYRNLRSLDVQPSEALRGVFDRMLASDREIATAKDAAAVGGPMFDSAAVMGVSEGEYAAFLKLHSRADEAATAKVMAEAMRPIQREKEKWWKQEREQVRVEVARDVNAAPVYRALDWMANRTWRGEGQPESMPDVRLSKDLLAERYGEGVLSLLPRGRQTIYALEGGMDPDDAAGFFGFGSGDQMVKALQEAPPRLKAIGDQTDRIMFERHGDTLRDGTVQETAVAAVHGSSRAQALAAELKTLTEVSGINQALTHKEAREIARQTLARAKVRDAIASRRYLVAERRAGEEAARLGRAVTRTNLWMQAARRRVGAAMRGALDGGADPLAVQGRAVEARESVARHNKDVARLVELKRQQLLNHALYEESRKIAEEVEKAERYANQLGKKTTREALAGDYLDAIDEILQRYDFRQMSGRRIARREALRAYIERMKAEGLENQLAIAEHVENPPPQSEKEIAARLNEARGSGLTAQHVRDAYRIPYTTLSVEHLRGVVESLKNIEHTARLKQTLIDARNERNLEKVVTSITDAFDANIAKNPPARVETRAEWARNKFRSALDIVLNPTTLLREIDGFQDEGATYRNLKAPIDEAMDRLQVARREAAERLEKLYSVYTAAERREMSRSKYIPSLSGSYSKWQLISIALNTGNLDNYQRLTDDRVSGHYTPFQVGNVLQSLDKRDADFIQSVWDYLESFKPKLEARERRVTGVAPKWVAPRSVTIAGKILKGGYYPLRYDPRMTNLSRDDQMQDLAQALMGGRFGKAQTKNGHLKERANASGRAVKIDMGVLHGHIDQVVRDLELSEAVGSSWRILQDGRVRDAFLQSGKQPDFEALEAWLKDVAEGEMRSSDLLSLSARVVKNNWTLAKLGFNLSTVAVQITGLAQSMVVVGKRDFVAGLTQSLRPGAIAQIAEKSSFMAERQTTFNKDIRDMFENQLNGPVASRWSNFKTKKLGPAAFYLMTRVQYTLVDAPTWLAAYQQGLKKFDGNDQRAVAHADAIVKRAQASGLFSDRSAIERGTLDSQRRQSDFVRLLSAMGGYLFTKFNAVYERTGKARRVIGQEGVSMKSAQEVLSYTIDFALLFTVEAVLYAAIKGRLPDEDDEDDTWPKFLVRETGLAMLSTMPVVRDIVGAASGFSSGGAYGSITEELGKPFVQAGQGELDLPAIKAAITATGLFTGLPAVQINRAVDAGWRDIEGEDVSPAEYLLGRSGK